MVGEEDIRNSFIGLANCYDGVIRETKLFNEITNCCMLFRTQKDLQPKTPWGIIPFLLSYGKDVVPHLRADCKY